MTTPLYDPRDTEAQLLRLAQARLVCQGHRNAAALIAEAAILGARPSLNDRVWCVAGPTLTVYGQPGEPLEGVLLGWAQQMELRSGE